MSGFLVSHECSENNIVSFKRIRIGDNERISSVWLKKLNLGSTGVENFLRINIYEIMKKFRRQ